MRKLFGLRSKTSNFVGNVYLVGNDFSVGDFILLKTILWMKSSTWEKKRLFGWTWGFSFYAVHKLTGRAGCEWWEKRLARGVCKFRNSKSEWSCINLHIREGIRNVSRLLSFFVILRHNLDLLKGKNLGLSMIFLHKLFVFVGTDPGTDQHLKKSQSRIPICIKEMRFVTSSCLWFFF